MSNPLIRSIIRTRFVLTSREKAYRIIRKNADSYMELGRKVLSQLGK